ncbi:MAG TPA: ABC transporter substrate-binding protein [Trueperaceae bacterium]
MKKLLLLLGLLLPLGLANAQTLVYGQSGLPVTLDSAAAQDGNSLTVSQQINETLVAHEPGGVKNIPGLATEWSPNEDASVWTFQLREGVTFHDGTPFNAEAVKFNFDRWNDPAHPQSFRDQGNTYAGFEYVFGGFKGQGSILDSVEVIDDHTVAFHLNKSVGYFPSMLSASYLGLDSPTAVKKAGIDYGTPGVGAVGTGPFKFVEWNEGEQVVLQRYDDYWGKKAKVDTLVFRGIEDPTARLAELQAGSIDIAVLLSPDDAATIKQNPNLKLVPTKGLNIGYLGLYQEGPLAKLKVRQAIAHAVDWDAVVDALYAGLGRRADQMIPPEIWGRSDKVKAFDYDPELSKKLLAEAGYPNGFDTEFWYMPVSRPYFPVPQPIASTITSYLAEVGINAELKTEDWGVYLSNYYTGKYPIYMLGWSPDYYDPDNYLFTWFGPGATGQAGLGWDAPQVLQWLQDARSAPTQEERAALYAKVNQAVYEQIPTIPVAYSDVVNATQANISGYLPSPFGSSVPLNLVSKGQ